MNAKWMRLVPAAFVLMMITSCGATESGGSHMQGYKETKSMVLDILKTEDGKKAILEATTGQGGALSLKSLSGSSGKISETGLDSLKMLSANESQQIQLAVKDVLTDTTNSSKMLEQLMTDPRFAGQFAKAIMKDNRQLHKDLMKDPEYQKSLIELMKNPEYQKILLDTMKGSQYRQQTMSVMQESMQSPMFRMELLDLLKKVMAEESKPKELQQGKGKSGSSQQSGQGQGESQKNQQQKSK